MPAVMGTPLKDSNKDSTDQRSVTDELHLRWANAIVSRCYLFVTIRHLMLLNDSEPRLRPLCPTGRFAGGKGSAVAGFT